MHEREKAAASIDVIAAGVNHEAARAAQMIEERRQAVTDSRLILRAGPTWNPDMSTDEIDEREDRLGRDRDLLDRMAEEVGRIREAAAAVQRLAAELGEAREIAF